MSTQLVPGTMTQEQRDAFPETLEAFYAAADARRARRIVAPLTKLEQEVLAALVDRGTLLSSNLSTKWVKTLNRLCDKGMATPQGSKYVTLYTAKEK